MAEKVVIGSAELWHGDCREVLPLLPHVALVLTDPPYGIGIDGQKQTLTQELLNSIMRNPGETRRNAAPVLPVCPRCGERYCGDGVQMCTECAASNLEIEES